MECIIYLADGCNLECTYCYEGDSKNTRIMNKETLVKALKFIANNRKTEDEIVYLLFLGGEPLLNKKILYEAINIINTKYKEISKYFKFSITTNATLLDQNTIEFLIKNKFNISISVDGDEETQNINRKSKNGKNLYPIVYKNLLDLIDLKTDFNVRMTITANNVCYFFKNIMFFSEMGVNRIYAGFDSFADWTDKTLNKFDDELGMIDKYYLTEIEPDNSKILNLYDFKLSTFIAKRNPQYCSAGARQHFTITSSGEVFPCGYVANVEQNKWLLGNVTEGVDFSKFIPLVKDNLHKLSKCKDCSIQFACKGAKCGFQNYIETGYLNKPSNAVCRLERILFKHQLYVFNEMFKKSSDRIMKNISLAVENDIELSDIMKNLLKMR